MFLPLYIITLVYVFYNIYFNNLPRLILNRLYLRHRMCYLFRQHNLRDKTYIHTSYQFFRNRRFECLLFQNSKNIFSYILLYRHTI